MPTKGQILRDPHTDDVYEFLETAQDTQGARTTLKLTLKKVGLLVPNHFHVLQEETFAVETGELTVWYAGQFQTLTAGQRLTLPKNQPHNHYNAGPAPVTFVQSVTPALDFDYLLENLIGLAADGKMPNGKAGLVQQMVSLRYLESKSFLADLPLGLQKVLINTIGPLGRLFGYRAIYKKYSGIEK